MADKITLNNAHNFHVKYDMDSKKYLIEETGEELIEWYQKHYEKWFFTYPGYADWTKDRFVKSTKVALKTIKECTYEELMPLAVNTVKDFIDIVNKERKDPKILEG